MRILFAHKNFPAQFGAFGEWLAGQGWEVAFLTQRAGAASAAYPGRRLPRRPPPAGRGHPPLPPAASRARSSPARPSPAPRSTSTGRALSPTSSCPTPAGGSGPSSRTSGPRPAPFPTSNGTTTGPMPTAPLTTPRRADPLDARARNRLRNAAALGRLLDREPRPLPDPLPGGAVPRVDARAADGDARRRRHRPPRAGRAGGRAGHPRPLGRAGGRRGRDLDHPRHGAPPRLSRDAAGGRAAPEAPPAPPRADRRRGPRRLRARSSPRARAGRAGCWPSSTSTFRASTSPGSSAGRTWWR